MNNKGKFNENRGFGVEIEFLRSNNVSKVNISEAIQDRNIECEVEDYNHITRPHWKIVSDVSVGSNMRGYTGSNEIVSPILYGKEGLKQLKTVLDVLKDLDCKVNYTCGIHVHHDVTDIVVQGKRQGEKFLSNLIKFVAKYEHLIYKLVSPSRLDNRNYSTPVRREYFEESRMRNRSSEGFNVTKKDIKKMVSTVKRDCNRKYNLNGNIVGRSQTYPYVQSNRACGLNFRNVWTRGAVEFRYLNGSLNFDKISSWVAITQAIINSVENTKAVQMTYVPNNISGFSSFRGAVGFIRRSGVAPSVGSFNRCSVVKKANTFLQRRFKSNLSRVTDYAVYNQYDYVKDGLQLNRRIGEA